MPSEIPTVHVIDDDEAARDSLAFLLRTAKIDVKTYESAMDFLVVVANVKSGCIITDVRMPEISGIDLLRRLKELKVDGGASVNNGLMQFQSDILGAVVRRPQVAETTALGAAYLAGLAVGYWKDQAEIAHNWVLDRDFHPAMPAQ